eukprot:scaffold2858_cov659-Pavlova_lutheri.AAC.60
MRHRNAAKCDGRIDEGMRSSSQVRSQVLGARYGATGRGGAWGRAQHKGKVEGRGSATGE